MEHTVQNSLQQICTRPLNFWLVYDCLCLCTLHFPNDKICSIFSRHCFLMHYYVQVFTTPLKRSSFLLQVQLTWYFLGLFIQDLSTLWECIGLLPKQSMYFIIIMYVLLDSYCIRDDLQDIIFNF